jgi:hypothetical protein
VNKPIDSTRATTREQIVVEPVRSSRALPAGCRNPAQIGILTIGSGDLGRIGTSAHGSGACSTILVAILVERSV